MEVKDSSICKLATQVTLLRLHRGRTLARPFKIEGEAGVKRGVLIDGSPNYSYFRALLEVKYKESGLLQGSQTRKYIDELARPLHRATGIRNNMAFIYGHCVFVYEF